MHNENADYFYCKGSCEGLSEYVGPPVVPTCTRLDCTRYTKALSSMKRDKFVELAADQGDDAAMAELGIEPVSEVAYEPAPEPDPIAEPEPVIEEQGEEVSYPMDVPEPSAASYAEASAGTTYADETIVGEEARDSNADVVQDASLFTFVPPAVEDAEAGKAQ